MLIVRWTLGLMALLYAVLVGVLQVAWRTRAIDIWWVQVLNVFGLWLYLPLPLCVLLALFIRPRLAAWLLIVPLVSFGWDYSAQLIPQHTLAGTTTHGPSFRVMSWNILWGHREMAAIVRTIEAQQPDIVALQELGIEQSALLEPLLARDYPYRALAPGGFDGLGVWSKYPIVEASPREHRDGGCACQRLVLEVAGRPLRLINYHPEAPRYRMRHWRPSRSLPYFPIPSAFNTERQEAPLQALIAEARNARGPLMIVGDFNLSDRQPNYKLLRRYLKDAFREAGTGFGLTFPNAQVGIGRFDFPPLLRIDYILHSTDLGATRAYTTGDPASDHRAVVADIKYEG